MIAEQLKISILTIRAVCEIQWVSYRFKHVLQPLSDTTFCAYLQL